MSTFTASSPADGRRLGRSVTAAVVATLVNVVFSLAIDQFFHVLGVYPPWGEPMYDPALNLLALSYRIVLGVVSGYLVARLAPHSPMKHAAVLGGLAVVVSGLGVIVAISKDLGPAWYPIALAVLAFPCVWVGAWIQQKRG